MRLVVGVVVTNGNTGSVAPRFIVIEPPALPVRVTGGTGIIEIIVPGFESIKKASGEDANPTRYTSPVVDLDPSEPMITSPPIAPWKNVPNSRFVDKVIMIGLGGCSWAYASEWHIVKNKAIITGMI